MSGSRPDLDALARELGPLAERDVPLGPLTTYRVGGAAALFVEAGTLEHLRAVGDALSRSPVPLLVVGKGSNLLVADAGFAGLAVRLATGASSEFAELAIGPATDGTGGAMAVRAGGAVGLPVLARRAVEAGARGLEWAVGVPGSVGGAVRMNAGGHGSDVAACLRRYGFSDLAARAAGEGDLERLAPGYRRSSIGVSEVVVWAEFKAVSGDVEEGRAELAEIVRWRRAHQPGGSNAGSVFANPPEEPAGALIERAGAKGLRLGSAAVSSKHANFIQADEGGSADDVWRLLQRVRAMVLAETGIHLATELRLIGFEDRSDEEEVPA